MKQYIVYEMEIVLFNEKDNFASIRCFSENEDDIYDEFSVDPGKSDI